MPPGIPAADRNRKPAEKSEQEWVALHRRSEGIWQAARRRHQDATEETAHQAARDTAQRYREPVDPVAQGHRAGAEICVVSHQSDRGQPRRNHRRDDEAGGAGFERTAHFLDPEHDSGQRRVKGGGHAGRGARQNQSRLTARREAPQREHDRGANLHSRPLASDRGAAQQAEQRHDHTARSPG